MRVCMYVSVLIWVTTTIAATATATTTATKAAIISREREKNAQKRRDSDSNLSSSSITWREIGLFLFLQSNKLVWMKYYPIEISNMFNPSFHSFLFLFFPSPATTCKVSVYNILSLIHFTSTRNLSFSTLSLIFFQTQTIKLLNVRPFTCVLFDILIHLFIYFHLIHWMLVSRVE